MLIYCFANLRIYNEIVIKLLYNMPTLGENPSLSISGGNEPQAIYGRLSGRKIACGEPVAKPATQVGLIVLNQSLDSMGNFGTANVKEVLIKSIPV